MRRWPFFLSSRALVVVSLSFAMSANASQPCRTKRQAKQEARRVLYRCLSFWARDLGPKDSDPSDDCSQQLASYVQSSKDVRACLIDLRKNHSNL